MGAGVIAQQVKQAITDAGLNWQDYGLITYEETKCEVDLVDGKYCPMDRDNCPLPLNADGFIEWIDGADSVDGSTYIRSAYMMRMEEFHSIKLAWIEKRLG